MPIPSACVIQFSAKSRYPQDVCVMMTVFSTATLSRIARSWSCGSRRSPLEHPKLERMKDNRSTRHADQRRTCAMFGHSEYMGALHRMVDILMAHTNSTWFCSSPLRHRDQHEFGTSQVIGQVLFQDGDFLCLPGVFKRVKLSAWNRRWYPTRVWKKSCVFPIWSSKMRQVHLPERPRKFEPGLLAGQEKWWWICLLWRKKPLYNRRDLVIVP